MKNKIRLGILGGGGDSLIGIVHRIASSMHDSYEIIGGVFNPNFSENVKFAKEIGLSENRIYEDYEKMIEEELKQDESERIEVVSILTPNFLHYPMAKKLLENNWPLDLIQVNNYNIQPLKNIDCLHMQSSGIVDNIKFIKN